jgi:hypothetical protein
LDEAVRLGVTGSGGAYTHSLVEKTNAPNFAYKSPDARRHFESDYEFILGCRRAEIRLE